MKKYQRSEYGLSKLMHLLVIPFLVVLLATGCFSSVPELEFMALESTCFTVHYTQGHEGAAQDVLAALEVNHDGITEDLKPTKKDKYAIWIYPNLNTFYQLGYSIADYVVQNWGWERSHDLVANAGDVNRALGMTEDGF